MRPMEMDQPDRQFYDNIQRNNENKDQNYSIRRTKYTNPSNPQQKSEQIRSQMRSIQIQNIKKSIRFNWNAEQTLQYLRAIDKRDREVQSSSFIQQALQTGNIQYLGDLIIAADALFRMVVLQKISQIMNLVQANLNKPASIIILGNLCLMYPQSIKIVLERKLLYKILQQLSTLLSSPQHCEIYSFTLANIVSHPHLLSQDRVIECVPLLYTCMIKTQTNGNNDQTHPCKRIFTHMCRVLLSFSTVLQFPEQFLQYVVKIQPPRCIDRTNLYLTLQNQIKMFTYSDKSQLRIAVIRSLLSQHKQLGSSLPKSGNKGTGNVYMLMEIIVRKSDLQVSEYVLQNWWDFITDYKYGITYYYKLLYQLLLKMPSVTAWLLQKLYLSSLLQNLVNDVEDNNTEIGFLAIKVLHIIVKDIFSNGQLQYIQWLLQMRMQSVVEKFLSNVGACKQAEDILDCIHLRG